jgi:hypothetical protein
MICKRGGTISHSAMSVLEVFFIFMLGGPGESLRLSYEAIAKAALLSPRTIGRAVRRLARAIPAADRELAALPSSIPHMIGTVIGRRSSASCFTAHECSCLSSRVLIISWPSSRCTWLSCCSALSESSAGAQVSMMAGTIRAAHERAKSTLAKLETTNRVQRWKSP